MGRKRARSEGSIYESPQGSGQWWAQLPAGPDGRRPRRKAPSEKEAVKLLRQMHAEREAGRDLSRRAETVEQLLNDWLESVAPQVRPGTERYYRFGIRHITNRIGKLKAEDVTIETVQRLANDLTKAGLTPATIRATLSRLRSAYERLIPERFSHNPVRWSRLKLRKAKTTERRPITAVQLRNLITEADNPTQLGVRTRYAPAIWLAGLLGLRNGEVLGLTWRSVDFEAQVIHIRKQRTNHSKSLLSDPKTEQSMRTLPMGPRLAARLKAHWEQIQAERRFRGTSWKEHGLVIVAEDGTPPPIGVLRRLLDTLAERHGHPSVHPHLLRHGVASLLDELGYSESVIAAILGHSGTKTTTRRYTHTRAEVLRRAIEALEAAVLIPSDQRREEAI